MNAPNTTAPLYVQFANQIRADIEAQGLPAPIAADTPSGFPENDGYFFVRWSGADSAALIVPKSKTRMGLIDSHLDLSGLDGWVALKKPNGRVVGRFEPDVSKVSKAFAQFVGASKRPVAPPVRRTISTSRPASQATPAATPNPLAIDFIEQLKALGWTPPAPQPAASQEPAPAYSDDEAEEALQALSNG